MLVLAILKTVFSYSADILFMFNLSLFIIFTSYRTQLFPLGKNDLKVAGASLILISSDSNVMLSGSGYNFSSSSFFNSCGFPAEEKQQDRVQPPTGQK